MSFWKSFKKFNPLAGALFGDAPDYASEAAKAEAARQERIKQGLSGVNEAFAGFTPTFYDQRAQAYVDYALPQLASQYQTTRNQLLQNLSSRGLLKSTAGKQQMSTLEKQSQSARQQIAEGGRAQSMELQRGVEDRRNSIIGQLYQSADPAGARASAVGTAASFTQPSAFAPLVNMFSNLANTYYTDALLEAARQSPVPTYAGGSFGMVNPSAVGGGVTSRRVN